MMYNNSSSNNVVEANVENDTNQHYISALNDMKKNSVSKAEHERVVNENRMLTEALVNGSAVDNTQPIEDSRDINEVREVLFGGESLSNLEYAKNVLELRDLELKSGNPDPFLPSGKNVVPSFEDETKAQNVADALKHAIEYSDGDSALFTQELQRITVDTAPRRR